MNNHNQSSARKDQSKVMSTVTTDNKAIAGRQEYRKEERGEDETGA